jgi:molybdopterin synthase catalytic subunit
MRVHVLGFNNDGLPFEKIFTIGGGCRSLECITAHAGINAGKAALYYGGRQVREVPSDAEEAYLLVPPPGPVAVKLLEPGEDIDLNAVSRILAKRGEVTGAGALVSFVGFVKGYVEGYRVKELYYEAVKGHVERMLQSIAEKYSKAPGVRDVAIYHYHGSRKPGDFTVYIFVTAVDRHQAFTTAAMILEEVKHYAPIYKLERREDGEYWILGDRTRIPRGKEFTS